MFIWGGIAATRTAAFLTRAQVKPPGADLDAFLTFPFLRVFNRDNSIDVVAGRFGHRSPLYPELGIWTEFLLSANLRLKATRFCTTKEDAASVTSD